MDGKLVLDHGTRMILAVAILLFGIHSTGLSSQENFAQTQAGVQSAPGSASTSQSSSKQNQGSTQPAAAPSQSNTSASQGTTPSQTSSPKKRPRKKKPAIAPCDASNSAGQAGGSNAASGSNSSATPQSETSTTPAAKDCPPPKVVVPQGGTTEPSIQLAGGAQVSQNRAEANHNLGLTEENLKKIAGLQLSEAQKDTVVQIRQFVDQSKAALADGNVERGKTLAWKAKLLSEDLVEPQK